MLKVLQFSSGVTGIFTSPITWDTELWCALLAQNCCGTAAGGSGPIFKQNPPSFLIYSSHRCWCVYLHIIIYIYLIFFIYIFKYTYLLLNGSSQKWYSCSVALWSVHEETDTDKAEWTKEMRTVLRESICTVWLTLYLPQCSGYPGRNDLIWEIIWKWQEQRNQWKRWRCAGQGTWGMAHRGRKWAGQCARKVGASDERQVWGASGDPTAFHSLPSLVRGLSGMNGEDP